MHTRYAPVRHSRPPEGGLTVRLACIRPAASVHPEPGSNSSLYYCLSLFLSLNLGFRFRFFCVPYLGSFRLPWPPGLENPCWPQTVKELANPLVLSPSLPSFAGAKVLLFILLTINFFIFFLSSSSTHCKTRRKNFNPLSHHHPNPYSKLQIPTIPY